MNSDITRVSHLIEKNVNYLGKWDMAVYVIVHPAKMPWTSDSIYQEVERLLYIIEKELLTREFNYKFFGFVVCHFGRRGVGITIWHWGDWDGTWEMFNHGWYCYGDNPDKLELLDVREPVFCNHDLNIILREIEIMKACLEAASSIDDLRLRYMRSPRP